MNGRTPLFLQQYTNALENWNQLTKLEDEDKCATDLNILVLAKDQGLDPSMLFSNLENGELI